jgi:hypothetical protein
MTPETPGAETPVERRLPPPGGFARRAGEPEGRCPYCSFRPTNLKDFCETHRPRVARCAAGGEEGT